MSDIPNKLLELEAFQKELELERLSLISKGMESSDPHSIIKAQQSWQDVQKKSGMEGKTILFDPMNITTNLNFKDSNSNVTSSTLRSMARTPIIRSIIGTRIEQLSEFSQPQPKEYSPGFVIRRKLLLSGNGKSSAKQDSQKIDYITKFIMNCGNGSNSWVGDDFDSFTRKFMTDSLILDQAVFEVIRDKKGRPVEFSAEDGALFRKSPDFNDPKYLAMYSNRNMALPDQVNGYFPSHVQVLRQEIQAEFYPWELCFGIRNPSTNIYSNGYGSSELEDLIRVVTWMLNGDDYNGKFFSQGSSPKGILKIQGQTNEARLAEFRQQWMAMVQGVQNAWKTPILEGDKVDWIDLQKSNQDMEFAKWQEYLIRLACALYKISPDEIGFDITKTSGGGLNSGSSEERLQYSKDKGLRPALAFQQKKINKYIVNALDPDFEFIYVGLEGNESSELGSDIKKLGSFMTINEIRDKRGLKPLKDGDIIANQYYMQQSQASQFGSEQSNNAVSEDGENGYDSEKGIESDPLLKGFLDYQKEILNEL